MVITEDELDKLYTIILVRDERYDDTFFFGVTSTGIYCRPSCPARRPLQKNCQFFTTLREAENSGFRACKRCRPDRPKNIMATLLYASLSLDLNIPDVRELADSFKLSERQFRRTIKRHTQATPLQIYRRQQLAYAYQLLRNTSLRIVDITYQANFKSVRQFNNLFKQYYNLSPSEIRKKGI